MDISPLFSPSSRGLFKGKPGWELAIRLTPKASHNRIGDIGVDANGQPYLKVYVTAVPEDQKANKALIELLSKTFHIPKSQIHILSGATDRRKIVGFDVDECPQILTK